MIYLCILLFKDIGLLINIFWYMSIGANVQYVCWMYLIIDLLSHKAHTPLSLIDKAVNDL